RRSGIVRGRSYLLTEFVAGTPLREFVARQKPGAEIVRNLAEQFCQIWRGLGTLHGGHGDMKESNFLVDPQNRLWMIDRGGMRVYPVGPLLHSERRKDIARFMRNWQEMPEVAAIFRARIGTG